jgi:hypothetical protein
MALELVMRCEETTVQQLVIVEDTVHQPVVVEDTVLPLPCVMETVEVLRLPGVLL